MPIASETNVRCGIEGECASLSLSLSKGIHFEKHLYQDLRKLEI